MNEFYLHDRIIYNGQIGWIKVLHLEENTALIDFLNGSRKIININFLKHDKKSLDIISV